jgi:hypothetical protein
LPHHTLAPAGIDVELAPGQVDVPRPGAQGSGQQDHQPVALIGIVELIGIFNIRPTSSSLSLVSKTVGGALSVLTV